MAAPRKPHSASSQPVKYCSDRCRGRRTGPVDRHIESVFAALLNGADPSTIKPLKGQEKDDAAQPLQNLAPLKLTKSKLVKGEKRIIADCSNVEKLIFGPRKLPGEIFGRRKNRASRTLGTKWGEWKSVDMEDDDNEDGPAGHYDSDDSGNRSDGSVGGVPVHIDWDKNNGPDGVYKGAGTVRPAQPDSKVNGSVGGEKGWAEKVEETPDMLDRRRRGQRMAEEREMVRRAARRGCAFGFIVDAEDMPGQEAIPRKKGKGKRNAKSETDDEAEAGSAGKKELRRKCEAIMSGTAVEASFAKGDWGIRWRE